MHLIEPARPLFEFNLPRSITQSSLADPPKRDSTSHELLLPSAHQGVEVHSPRALPARYVPPSGFGYPLDGLLPRLPRRFCFAPAALLGFTLRSVSSREVLPTFPPGMSHLPFSLAVVPSAEAVGRPDEPRFLGSIPHKSPCRWHTVLARQPQDAPLGFSLPGHAGDGLGRTFTQPPLSRFTPQAEAHVAGASESRQPSLGSTHALRETRRGRAEQPS
jgi:hypothetical protein